jgi:hypothetical protein
VKRSQKSGKGALKLKL